MKISTENASCVYTLTEVRNAVKNAPSHKWFSPARRILQGIIERMEQLNLKEVKEKDLSKDEQKCLRWALPILD